MVFFSSISVTVAVFKSALPLPWQAVRQSVSSPMPFLHTYVNALIFRGVGIGNDFVDDL